MISVGIVSFNEANNLSQLLKSVVDFADEIIVLDLGSTDNTVRVSQRFGAKIIKHKFVPFVELVRNYLILKTGGNWVLILDPDEQMSDNLKNRLKQIVKDNKYDAVNIPRKNIFFGKWVSHTNWWPDRHVRFFKRGKVSWENKIHSYPRVDGELLELPAKEELAIIHHGYNTISEFIDRQNRYSSIEAQNLYDLRKRFSWTNFFWKPVREFLVRFIRHAGFLDGFWGFALTYLMMIYQLQVLIKLWEKEKNQ